MTLQLQVYPQAKLDVREIMVWLREQSPQGAERWFNRYLEMLRLLPDCALGCALAPEADSVGQEIRQLLFRTRRGHNYRTLFVIMSDAIHVLAVRG